MSSSLCKMSKAYRVAVVGAGVSGCAAARRLAGSSNSSSASVTLYEIGRGPGGRASSRRTRSIPDLLVNHGCPYAPIRSPEARALVSTLPNVVPFEGVRGVLDAKTGSFVPEDGDDDDDDGVRYVTGEGGEMSRISSDLVQGDASSSSSSSVTTRYRTIVRGLSRNADGEWELYDEDGKTIGVADWLVVSASGVAHPRWSTTFGGEPPLVKAAKDLNDSDLDRALETVARQTSSPVLVVLFALSGDEARPWNSLGYDVADVEKDEVLSRIVVVRKGDWCSVALHSTEEFALRNQGVFGSTSSAARVGKASSDPTRERELVEKMLTSLGSVPGVPSVSGILANDDDDDASSEPKRYGPFLHRWGSAFPRGEALPSEHAFIPSSRIGFCGDHVDPATEGVRIGTLECALLTGTRIGEKISEHENEKR